MQDTFHDKLKDLMDSFVKQVYLVTKFFPKDEIYGLTSQLRRAALSVILNYIEGYARRRKLVLKNFLEISYGSLKEAAYLIEFSYDQKYLNNVESYQYLVDSADKIGAMLYGTIKKLP